MMTRKAATEFARIALAHFAKHSGQDGIGLDLAIALEGSGWSIPATAYADGDDRRTITNMATWIRRNAVASNAVGRPAKMDDGKRKNVYLDAASLARAAELGNGNISEGIRIALQGSKK
jgi:hypothetical protein